MGIQTGSFLARCTKVGDRGQRVVSCRKGSNGTKWGFIYCFLWTEGEGL